MAALLVNPNYRQFLAAEGLTAPQVFLRLQGVITSGHQDRHVVSLNLGQSDFTLPVLLKREHRCRWRDRWHNLAAGFGFVSRSLREWRTLSHLGSLGIACPEPIAAGEDGEGRAFLLVRQVPDAVELRQYLSQVWCEQDGMALARELGNAVARLHDAGYCHFDLYSKHVLVRSAPEPIERAFVFVDWQRAFQSQRLPWRHRLRDLSCLSSSLSEEVFGAQCRALFVEAYLASQGQRELHIPKPRLALHELECQVQRLLRRRQTRELRQPPLNAGAQNLIWLDGEALCVTRSFLEHCRGSLPPDFSPYGSTATSATTCCDINLLGKKATMVRREEWRPWSRCWHAVRGRAQPCREIQQAATIFRLERFQVSVPELLAVGQRPGALGRMSSFLLTEAQANAQPLRNWLDADCSQHGNGRLLRKKVIEGAGKSLRSIHAADCVLGQEAQFIIHWTDGSRFTIGVNCVRGMRPRRRVSRAAQRSDLHRMMTEFALVCNAGEKLRFLLSYLNIARLTPAAKRLIRTLAPPRRHDALQPMTWRSRP